MYGLEGDRHAALADRRRCSVVLGECGGAGNGGWVPNADRGTVSRIDVETRQLTHTINVKRIPGSSWDDGERDQRGVTFTTALVGLRASA